MFEVLFLQTPPFLRSFLSSSFKDVKDLIFYVDGFAAVLAVLITGASQSRQHGKVSSISIGGSISSEGFLSSILLSVVIIVTVVFVVVVLVVVVIAIVGVVIVVVFGIIVVVVLLVSVFSLGLLALAIDAACAFRAEEMPSLISCRMAAKVMAGVSDVDVLLGGILST
ncbi:hypothetical protein Tco_1186165 [Tanacetum coccineum]